MFAMFRGKRWKIRWLPPEKVTYPNTDKPVDGLCDGPSVRNKQIIFRDNFRRSRTELETFIHEALHACCWDLNEPAVFESAADIAKFLWRLGYRRKEE